MEADRPNRPPTPPLASMGIGDILEKTVRLYAARFVPFLTISLAAYAPLGIILALLAPPAGAPARPAGAGAGLRSLIDALPGAVAVAAAFALLLFPVAAAVLADQVSSARAGEAAGGVESLRRTARRLPKVLLATLAAGAVAGAGLVLVVPGAVLAIGFVAVPAIAALEPVGPIEALRRSRALLKGNFGKGLLVLAGGAVLAWAIGKIIGGVIAFVSMPEFLKVFLDILLAALVLPLWTVPPILLYFELRERRAAAAAEELVRELTAGRSA